jgi:CheY-like chemotaxis protein
VSKQILVVDDDAGIRETLCEALELEGYQVVCLEHGQAALDYLQSAAPPCVVLLDVMMPVMDGRELRRQMLRDPKLAQIPVVIITAGGTGAASGVAAVDVLYKPLRIETVINSVGRHCPDAVS